MSSGPLANNSMLRMTHSSEASSCGQSLLSQRLTLAVLLASAAAGNHLRPEVILIVTDGPKETQLVSCRSRKGKEGIVKTKAWNRTSSAQGPKSLRKRGSRPKPSQAWLTPCERNADGRCFQNLESVPYREAPEASETKNARCEMDSRAPGLGIL